jgi:hypothetical protein
MRTFWQGVEAHSLLLSLLASVPPSLRPSSSPSFLSSPHNLSTSIPFSLPLVICETILTSFCSYPHYGGSFDCFSYHFLLLFYLPPYLFSLLLFSSSFIISSRHLSKSLFILFIHISFSSLFLFSPPFSLFLFSLPLTESLLTASYVLLSFSSFLFISIFLSNLRHTFFSPITLPLFSTSYRVSPDCFCG